LLFTHEEIARIALERGTGTRGLRAVVEEVLEAVLFVGISQFRSKATKEYAKEKKEQQPVLTPVREMKRNGPLTSSCKSTAVEFY
jgi:ATP-dependent protease Clp ATPase subunit